MPFSLLADKASINEVLEKRCITILVIGGVAVVSYTGWEIGRFALPNVVYPETVANETHVGV